MAENPVILFNKASFDCSKIVTTAYSTSFSSAISLLHPDLRNPIHGIYGFVRLADEIVDSFHHQDKAELLNAFEDETYAAITRGLSVNPIIHSFQATVRKYNIDEQLVADFLYSMKMDLHKSVYDDVQDFNKYIHGSAEVVGLMCLYVFCEGDKEKYLELKPAASALGAAFQKVNFLRDLKADYETLERSYFPEFNFNDFYQITKSSIEKSIEADFKASYVGILKLPLKARFGVYVAYKYYTALFKKIQQMKPEHILQNRVRIPNYTKACLLITARIENKFNFYRK